MKGNGATSTTASLDATFETLHPSFAKRWAPSPDAAPCSYLNGESHSETEKKCLTSSTSNNNNIGSNSSSTEKRIASDNNKLGDSNGPVSSHADPAAMPGSTLNGQGCANSYAGVPLNAHARATATSQLLFLVRHGQTDMNAAGKLQGRGVNAHLNAAGLAQAEGLGRFVRNVPFDTVTASSLHRAHEVRRCCLLLSASLARQRG